MPRHTRTRPPARKPRVGKKRRASKEKPQQNREAREGWKFPHAYEGEILPPVPDPDRWMSRQEAATRLGVTLKTIRKYIDSGTLESKRHGYYRLIAKASVEALAGKK